MTATTPKPFPQIPLTPLDVAQSRSVRATGYDPASQRFAVQFKAGGKLYHYLGVSQAQADRITTAARVGSAVRAELVDAGVPFEREP